jgi:hypothetical protein
MLEKNIDTYCKMKKLTTIILLLTLFTSCTVVKDIFRKKEKENTYEEIEKIDSVKNTGYDSTFTFEHKDIDWSRTFTVHVPSGDGAISVLADGSFSVSGAGASLTIVDSGRDNTISNSGAVSNRADIATSTDRSRKETATQSRETQKEIKRRPAISLFIGLGILIIFIIIGARIWWKLK